MLRLGRTMFFYRVSPSMASALDLLRVFALERVNISHGRSILFEIAYTEILSNGQSLQISGETNGH